MRLRSSLGMLCLALGVASAATHAHVVQEAQSAAPQKPPVPSEEAKAAVSASPQLVGELAKELGATPEQAAGAAGALFGVAKSRLKADEFSQVADAVPGMDALLKAAPSAGTPIGTTGGLSKAVGSASGLASAATAFTKLGLKPDMVGKAVPVLTSHVTKSGGADVGRLLAGALK